MLCFSKFLEKDFTCNVVECQTSNSSVKCIYKIKEEERREGIGREKKTKEDVQVSV